jgi:hypothetical protein
LVCVFVLVECDAVERETGAGKMCLGSGRKIDGANRFICLSLLKLSIEFIEKVERKGDILK